MRHSFIDKYSDGQSIIHRVDPRIKLIVFLSFILFVVSTGPAAFTCFALYGACLTVLIFLSGIPFGFVIKRSLVIIPFVLAIAVFIPFFREGEIAGMFSFGPIDLTVTHDGLMVFWNVLAKAYLSVLCLILLTSSTRFPDLLKALERLHLPRLFVMILSFMYRYIFLVMDEFMIMKRAKDSRLISNSKWLHIRVLANMTGALFIKSYERAENVYLAMCSRGFSGQIRTLSTFQLKKSDLNFIIILTIVLTGIRLIGN